jgi:hypothetical protein
MFWSTMTTYPTAEFAQLVAGAANHGQENPRAKAEGTAVLVSHKRKTMPNYEAEYWLAQLKGVERAILFMQKKN